MKFVTADVKGLGEPEADGPGMFEVVLSAPTLDRDGEVIDSGAFDPLPAWINFDTDHAMKVEKTVGSGVPRYENGLLKVRGTYASTELGQLVRVLVGEGHIRQTSVAFHRPQTNTAKDGTVHIVKAELLNGAFVGVPSNRDALVLVSKGASAKGGGAAPAQMHATIAEAMLALADADLRELRRKHGAPAGRARAQVNEFLRSIAQKETR